jgi:hypothetical protein
MKTREQLVAEAKFRQQEIARKTKKLGVTKCGNVKTSFGRCTPEYLEGMGFFAKGSDRKPSKSGVSEKRLNKEIVQIDVRKKVV